MKIFKSLDEKIKELGFKEVESSAYGVTYSRYDVIFEYTQLVEIYHHRTGTHAIASFQKGTNSDGFNNVVSLTIAESVLFTKKARKLSDDFKKYQKQLYK